VTCPNMWLHRVVLLVLLGTTQHLVSFAHAAEVAGLVFGEPLSGLDEITKQAFNDGFRTFVRVWKPREGLGRFINGRSCVSCHSEPVPAGSGTRANTFVLSGLRATDQTGGHIFARFEVSGETNKSRELPDGEMARRKSPGLFGLGLLESVSDESILAHSLSNKAKGSEAVGRLPLVPGGYGRFGWRSEFASIRDVVAHALVVELGFPPSVRTSESLRGARNRELGMLLTVSALTEFCRMLSPPPSRHLTNDAQTGRRIFSQIGCASCHSESLTTSPVAPPQLRSVAFHPFTDLLLHRMGTRIADSFSTGDVAADEFRTPPLWGLTSTGPPFLHDGRASTLEEAVLLHEGEAATVTVRYRQLTRADQSRLLLFLSSL